MLKPFQIACVAGTGLTVIAAFLLAGERAPNSDAATRLALQKTTARSNDDVQGKVADAGWIGVMLEADKAGGLRVKDVFPGGPAAFAGVRVGDVLLMIGEKSPKSEADITSAIEHLSPKQQTTLTIQRGKQKLNLKVTADSLLEFNGRYASEMMRRDPRHPKFAEHQGVSAADMNVELVRRLFEQNQRLETLMHELRQEVHALRTEVRGSKK